MRKKVVFIYNPNAGKKKIQGKLNEILEILAEEQCELVVSPTRKKLDAMETVMEYVQDDSCTKIICSGGDGTLHEIINGLMRQEKRVPIVYIPAGSTNDFGYSLNIPSDMIQAAELSTEGMEFPCDIAGFNEDFFVYTAAFGLFTEVSYATPQALKNVLGHMAYVLNGAGELTHVKKYHMRVEYNDQVIEDDFIYGMVVSSQSVGGFRGITGSDVSLNDGEYEMFLIRDGSAAQVPALINDILKGRFQHPRIVYAKVKRVTFQSDEDVSWTMDGEYGGTIKDVEICVHQRAVNFLIPRSLLSHFEQNDGSQEKTL